MGALGSEVYPRWTIPVALAGLEVDILFEEFPQSKIPGSASLAFPDHHHMGKFYNEVTESRARTSFNSITLQH